MTHGVFKERSKGGHKDEGNHKKHSAKREHRVGVPLSKHDRQDAWAAGAALANVAKRVY